MLFFANGMKVVAEHTIVLLYIGTSCQVSKSDSESGIPRSTSCLSSLVLRPRQRLCSIMFSCNSRKVASVPSKTLL